ncbi:site-specific DNA-methyltransferase [Arcanobacterium bovis]|uniref:Site-specific DNA-methyltransferase n=1 Tax=Arcanobacterium bovis TaxID=2529275 RepID=A0A4Q9V2F7_9ACTO|nr:site-specific DNA-methyltransferase [Arcanobacterium bovis]TBW23778.1 site-specific DNA-methyltransferase [Arcanobacterium bovis]
MTDGFGVVEETGDIHEISPASPDFRTELAEQIADLAPEAVADGKIDFEKLKELLSDDVSSSPERFGLFWPGKKQAIRTAQSPTTATLQPDFENSKNWDTTQNVFIEGDNLEVLKVLQNHYYGKIKMIYIDPPYNTGKDFVYKDDFRDGMKNYLEWTEQVNGEGKKASSNSESEGRYHSNWLNMMYPRLKLARNLLTDDGAIVISINEKEQSHLKDLCDEVFGENNLIAQFIWRNEGNVDQQSKVKGVHEYILAYARQADRFAKPTVIDPNISENSKLFKKEIENSITKNGPANPPSSVFLPKGFPANFDSGIIRKRTDLYPYYENDIQVESGKTRNPGNVYSGWSSRNLLELFIKNGFTPIVDSEDRETRFELRETGAIYMVKLRKDDQGHVISVLSNFGTTKKNSSLLGDMGIFFSFPKPILLIQYLISIFTATSSGDQILDFFAGSATTAHAVMQLNAEDGGNRNFIMVQLPEPTDEKSEARQAGYYTIPEISRERIRRAGEKILAEEKSKLDGRTDLDTGFRAYKLTDTNFTKWNVGSDVTETILQGELLSTVDSASDGSRIDDLFTELLLKQGMSLTEKVDNIEISGVSLRAVHDNEGGLAVLAYLDEHQSPTLEQLRAFIDTKPARFVILEDAFKGNDELKTNLVQMCKINHVELWTA